jgi:hypothetical protein
MIQRKTRDSSGIIILYRCYSRLIEDFELVQPRYHCKVVSEKMLTLRLTNADFRKSEWHWSDYVGKHDLSNCESNIEIDPDLGCVSFPVLKAKGSITALAGTGIKVAEGIEAGAGIKSDWAIQAGGDIRANKGIVAGTDIKAGGGLVAGWSILAGEGIEAGKDIEARTGIRANTAIRADGNIESGAGLRAGWSITAGKNIEVAEGIESGLAIQCKGILKVRLRVFAGLSLWRLPTEAEKKITCSKFEGGSVAHGTLVESP